MPQLFEKNLLSAENLICIEEGFRSLCSFCEHSRYIDIAPEPGFGVRHRSKFKLCRDGVSDVEISLPCSGFELAEILKVRQS